MKRIIILHSVILIAIVSTFSQNMVATWPISGKKAGEKMLFKPQDYIGTEKNFADLFIAASEGTPVVSPVNGTITNLGYIYSNTLYTCISFHDSIFSTSGITEYDVFQRNKIAESKGYNSKFVSIDICISLGSGEKYYIRGLRPVKILKTGQKIKMGDVIGTVGYCYKLINEPCIWLSRSLNGKSSDPMTPFGLKTTFIPWKPLSVRQTIPATELLADFEVFRQALEEGHPGLYDYTSHANMDSTFERVRRKISEPISPSKFYKLLSPVLDSLRDSHTFLINPAGQSNKTQQTEYFDLPIHFGIQHDSLIVFQTLPTHSNLLGKQILTLDKDSVSTLNKKINVYTGGSEGRIQVKQEWLRLNFFYYYYKFYRKSKNGDSLIISFSDGTQQQFTYKAVNFNDFIPKVLQKPKASECNLELKKIDDSTSYLRVRSFEFSDIDVDSLRVIIKRLSSSTCKNIIIDIRDNPGGYSHNQLFATLAAKPFQSEMSSMVKSNGKYAFFKNVPSYSAIDYIELFPEYKKIKDKDGYYILNEKFENPNDSLHFAGKVYLLTNENSFSASTLFAAMVHKYNRGKIIGRETGSCYYQMNAWKFTTVHLNNSNLDLLMPLVKVIFDDKMNESIPWGHGVIPDYIIPWTFKEALNTGDPILDFTLNLIRKNVDTK